MKFPLEIRFKIIALAPQLSVTDAAGELVFYVQQKLFKLKEQVTVYGDRAKSRPLVTIEADRVLDVSAAYRFKQRDGTTLGAVKRRGVRSIWKAHYDVMRDNETVMTIREKNPWIKVLDSVVGDIPIVGALANFFLHPSYMVSRTDGTALLRVKKQPALFETRFGIDRLTDFDTGDEALMILAVLMMILLERERG